MRYLNSDWSIHPLNDVQQVTIDSGVKPVSSDIKGNSMTEEGVFDCHSLAGISLHNYYGGSEQ